MNNGFNKFKVDDSTHVKMLIIRKMWEKSLSDSNIIAKHSTPCVSIHFNKCKMQFMNNGFDILNVKGLIHVHIFIVSEIWKKILIHSNINMGF